MSRSVPSSVTTAVVLLVAVPLVALLLIGSSAVRTHAAPPCWRPPVAGSIADPFRPPPCPWCAGNRGIEFDTAPGALVRSVAPGRVTFSGVVAGTRYVVVELATGWRVTYGRLRSGAVRTGAHVVAASVIGRSSGALFFGLRVHGEYTDPARHIGELVGRARLVPLDGSPPRPGPAPQVRCDRRAPR